MDNAIKCSKCDGRGKIEGFGHIDNGKCFQCGGAGTVKAGHKSARSLISSAVYTGGIVMEALLWGDRARAEFYAERCAEDLHKYGTEIAKAALNQMLSGVFYDDEDSRYVRPDLGRAAAELIIAKGRVAA